MSSDRRSATEQKADLTPCERAFKEWLEGNFGAVSPATNATYWQAFRAGWYAARRLK